MEEKKYLKTLRTVAKVFLVISAVIGFPTIIGFIFSLVGLNYIAEIEAKERKRSMGMSIALLIFANIVSGIMLIIDAKENKDAEVIEITKEVKKGQKKRKKAMAKRVMGVFSYILIGLLVAIDGIALYSKLSMKGESGGLPLFDKEARIVLTGSMDNQEDSYYTTGEGKDYEIKRIPVHSMVFIEKAPSILDKEALREFYSKVKINDVLTFNYQLGGQFYVVTHRVIAINDSNPDSIVFTLRGDNPTGDSVVSKYSPTQSARSDSGYIIGKVVGQNEFLGNIAYAFVGNPMVLVFIVIIPSTILMFYEIGNVVIFIYLSRKEKKEEEDKDD